MNRPTGLSLMHFGAVVALVSGACRGGGGCQDGGGSPGPDWYVNAAAPAGGDGKSWMTAFQHPQDAVDAAAGGDEVWVAGGVYTRREDTDRTLLTMKNGVLIYGGIAAGAATREGRDLAANETILDGDADGDLVGEVYHVVTGAWGGRLDGFTLTHGNANGGGFEDGRGGGMYNSNVDHLVIANCTFSDNFAAGEGGGMCSHYSDLEVSSCTFVDNVGDWGGGGMSMLGSSTDVSNCVFRGNRASVVWGKGGGLRSRGSLFGRESSFSARNCTIYGNSADAGGAVYNDDKSFAAFTNCIIWGNSAVTGGAGIENYRRWYYCTLTRTCVQGGYEGVGNFDSDPLFADAAAGDLRLRAGSPCIDVADGAAAPPADIELHARHDDPGVANCGAGQVPYADIGAYEFPGTSEGRWLEVRSPRDGQMCRAGDELRIVWHASSEFGEVKLELSRDGGTDWETLADSTPNDGSFDWTITDGGRGLPQTECSLRISDARDQSISDKAERLVIFSGILYVDSDAPPGGRGTSWESAFNHPQHALDAAPAGCEVRVAEGSYVALDAGDRQVVAMKPGVSLMGGYAGYGAADPDERDLLAYETILDGEGQRTVVVGASDAKVEGLTVIGGDTGATGSDFGGGMHNYCADNLVVSSCVFRGNSSQYGGGMYNELTTGLTVSNCVLDGNSANYGGGICNEDVNGLVVSRCVFSNNVTSKSGGGMRNSESSPEIFNCTFEGNTALTDGGAVYSNRQSYASLVNCTMAGNSADSGGAIYSYYDCLVSVTNCIVWGNSATSGEPQIEIAHETSACAATYSCVEGGYEGLGNFDENPLFVAAGAGDLRLQAGSPCIDAGDGDVAPAADIEGNPRHDDPGVANCGQGAVTYCDIGAHEFTGMSAGRWLSLKGLSQISPHTVGAEIHLVWHASSDFAEVTVELSRDGGASWETLAGRTSNDGDFAWVVTDGGVALPQRQCLLHVCDADDNSLNDTSNVFAIYSGVLCVDGDVAPGGDGLSWDLAFTHPQEALDVPAAVSEVHVAGGTYVARKPEDTAVLAMRQGVALRGGYAGQGYADPDVRDLIGYESVMDGEGARTVVIGASDAILDGFTVTRGSGNGMRNVACNPVVRDCRFTENDGHDGGGMYNRGASPTVIDCLFMGNTATWGAGMKSYGEGSPVVIGCRFVSNAATGGSGGIDNFRDSSIIVTDCLFWANDGAAFGGGVHNSSASAIITNCTIFGNTAQRGGGIDNETLTGPGTVTVTNCILWDNTAAEGPEIYSDPGSTSTVTYSCVEGGWTGVGNIGDLPEHDPLFVDPDGLNDIPGDEDDDFRLQPGSPCIDAGDPATTLAEDIEGNPRPAGSGYDMGAYEYVQ